MKRNSYGFTMVEVIIVLLILGTISAVAIPIVKSNLDEIKIDGAAREIVSVLYYCQSLAIKEGIAYTVNYDVAQEKFRCYDTISGLTVLHPIDKRPYETDFTAEGPFQGADIVSAKFTPGNKSFMTFNNLGEPDRGGPVIISYRGFQRTIDISMPMGKVSVY